MNTRRITIFVVSLALFMDVLDSNIINTAIPAMSHSLEVAPIDLKIALISYLLSLAIFIPMSGWVADHYGAKNIFITAMGLFTATSFFCGYSHTLTQLIVARSIQGIGGAFMISLGRLMIARTFPRHEMVEAMNVIIIVVSIGVMIGPFIGGVIVDHWSWPWIFWVNIPAGIFSIVLAILGLKEVGTRNPRPFDFLGFVLFGGSLAMMCFSLSEMSESHRDMHAALFRFILSVFGLLFYVFHAKRKKHPAIRIDLLRIRTLRVSVFGNLSARIGFGGMPFLLPLLQQMGLGLSAAMSGLLMVPIALGIMTSKVLAFRVLRRLGYRNYLITNTVLVGLILWVFQLITIRTPLYMIAILTFVFGVFISAQYTGMNSLALAEVKDEELSASTSITSTVQVIAQSFGVAVSALLLRLYSSFTQQHSLQLTPALFHHVFFTLGAITMLSIFIFFRLKPNDGSQMLVKRAMS